MKRLVVVLSVLALFVFPALVRADTWDLVNDFSSTSNPNGAWSYGWEPAGSPGGGADAIQLRIFRWVRPSMD